MKGRVWTAGAGAGEFSTGGGFGAGYAESCQQGAGWPGTGAGQGSTRGLIEAEIDGLDMAGSRGRGVSAGDRNVLLKACGFGILAYLTRPGSAERRRAV